MATSVYFSGAVKSEQDLYEDLVTESIKIFGQDVVYLPREQVSEDDLLNEVVNQYTQAFPVEMYLENVDGFEGDGNLLGKFGLEIRDQGTFVVTRRRWEAAAILLQLNCLNTMTSTLTLVGMRLMQLNGIMLHHIVIL